MVLTGFALAATPLPGVAPVGGGGLPVPRIEPAPPPADYRLIARIGADQGAEAAIFLHEIAGRGSERVVGILIVPTRKTHRYRRGRPSHGRAWYQVSCDLGAMRVVSSRVYDPNDILLAEHNRSHERPMTRALPSATRYPDLILPYACGTAAEGAAFRDPLAAIAHARKAPARP